MKPASFVAFLIVVPVLGCDAEPTSHVDGRASIEIEGIPQLTQNRIHRFDVVVRDDSGEEVEADVEWGSSRPSLATIDVNGRVRALRPGELFIRAYVGELTDSVALTIVPGVVDSVHGFSLPDELHAGEVVALDLRALDADGQSLLGRNVLLWSEDPDIVQLAGSSLRAVGVGTTLIHVQADDVVDSALVTVLPARVYHGMLNIIAVDGAGVLPHDTVLVPDPTFALKIRVALGEEDAVPDLIALQEETGLQWNALFPALAPGDTVDLVMPLTGPVIGVTGVRLVAASFMTGPFAESEPVYLKSPNPYLEARIREINGVPVTDGVVPVADRFELVLEVDVPPQVTIPVDWMGVRARLSLLDDLTVSLGGRPGGAFTLQPGRHEFAFTAPVAPPGRYTLLATLQHGARHITVDRVEVEVTNSDVVPPTVGAPGGMDTVTVAVPDPPILVDLADAESGLFGVHFGMHWQVTDDYFVYGPCASRHFGYFLDAGIVHQARWLFHVSECFDFRLNPGANPMTLGAYDNATNEGSIPFVLVYDPDADGAAHGVHIGPDGVRGMDAGEAARAGEEPREWAVIERTAEREFLMGSDGATAEHAVTRHPR